ncbi:MAG TPA: uracil-DNA glycosylase [Vicinamibacterales bacterium]|jgi:DNA polymerase|nr:uracil-DNA glycosylase [Vicinamibacterales bacterium]
MTDIRRQIADHLRFYSELGVIGVNTNRPEHPSSTIGHRTSDIGHPSSDTVRIYGSGSEALAAIRADVGDDCSRCKLHTLGRKQIVFGVGDPNADLMFVGEAPGADEDIQGIPFVGRAGQLLTKMIEAINLKREQVYIANVIKCRPPGNRNPEPDEIEQCEPFLFRQIEAVKPKVIVALGSFAAKTLLRSDESISRLRGRIYDFRGAKLIPTFHPSFLLRSPDRKRDAWEDLKKARALIAAGPKDTARGDKG